MAFRIPNIDRGSPFEIFINGKGVTAYYGETVATVMIASGIKAFFIHADSYSPSRLFCGMGTCQQCLVIIDDLPNIQACRTLAQPGMKVTTTNEHQSL